jgi:hypothetical protein
VRRIGERENALIGGRRWEREEFSQFFVKAWGKALIGFVFTVRR